MKISYNWLKDYLVGKLPSAKKLADGLTMRSFEVEEIKKVGRDFVLDIDVLPNRAGDCLSHIGVAREVAAILNLKLKNLTNIATARKVRRKGKKDLVAAKDLVTVEVADKNLCSRYTVQVISGVEVKPSPKRMQERLKICGLQPINNIVDITNYVMLETGQPLHAFDFEKIKSENPKSPMKEIIVRRAQRGEEIKSLDGKSYRLDKDILVIADAKGPIAMAGVKGGEDTAIDSKTTKVAIEAGNWNQKTIRLASQKLKLKTDASWRFENGIDPNLIDFAQERAAFLIRKIAHSPGGSPKAAGGLVDFYPQKVLPKKIRLDLDYVDSLLGTKLLATEVLKILKSLGFQPSEVELRRVAVEVPTRRLDVARQEDLIEEIGRIAGYENVPSIFPHVAVVPPERNDEVFWKNFCRNILKEGGFSEVYNYSFCGEKEKEIFGLKNDELQELENPASSFYKYLRPSLIPNLLKNVKENLRFFEEVKVFEIGKIFKKCQILEKKMLTGALARKDGGEDGFYELKGVVDSFLHKLGISSVWYDEYQPTPEDSALGIWHAKRCAEIKSDGKEIGFLGEINPRIINELLIKERVFIFEFDFENLLKLTCEEHEYQPISAYPAAVRDLALLVPQGTKVVEVLNIIEQEGGKLVRDVDLFDIYQGEAVPEDKQNLAFHIIYQAEDRTLSSREIDQVQQKIIKALEENPSWEVRR